ncbi:hypothetical protein [Acidovorax sp. CCYZU-2555]|uniref:hypothetical protein n=1 Tax=Acidovorax sp. CCYZU-2555 TaxID=2835042 RepID=UPI001BCB01D1|nr:hypothetical protein [Acidovorax sp. CCYZU-2555]MBS7779596.1 hypothetical protein [Acidovorax sp. CCYZU-2555]
MTRTAPPRLRYALVRPPRALGCALLALAGLCAAALLLWARQGAAPWPAAMGLLLWLVVCNGAWRCWRAWPEGRLEWDGDRWWLQRSAGSPDAPHARPQALPAAPRVCWDGQDFLLLHVHGRLRGGWLWLQRASAPALWGDLRRTVYWRPRPAQST